MGNLETTIYNIVCDINTYLSNYILIVLLVGVGLSQLFAVLPGVSRSGTTMSAGLMRGFDRDFAVRFAFLLSIPAVVGSTVFALPDMLAEGGGMDPLLALVGFVSSAISGWIAIKTVRLLMKKGSFRWFALYCACAGTAAIVLSLI